MEFDQGIIDDETLFLAGEFYDQRVVWPDRRRKIPAPPHDEVWCFRDAQIEQSLLHHIEGILPIEIENLAGADLVAENRNTVRHAAGDVITDPGLARAAFGAD